MLKQFIDNEDPVYHVMRDFKMDMSLMPTEEEMTILKPIVEALSYIDSVGRKIGARKATLASADFMFEKLIGKLSTIDSPFAMRLNGAVQTRIEERRLTILSTLMAFLENPSFLDSTRNLHLQYADRNELIKSAKELLIDLKLDKDEEPEQNENIGGQEMEHSETETEPMEPTAIPPVRSFSDELNDSLAQREAEQYNVGAQESTVTLASIRRDFKKYEGTGIRPKTLEKVYQALRSIPPTSTGNERTILKMVLFP